jgi:hypothetical protein
MSAKQLEFPAGMTGCSCGLTNQLLPLKADVRDRGKQALSLSQTVHPASADPHSHSVVFMLSRKPTVSLRNKATNTTNKNSKYI